MIGNMWVIPKDSKRPEDARFKTPVESKSSEISALRKDLKKLLKDLFKMADEKKVPESDKRNSVLSVIAYSLCAAFMSEKKLLTEVYDTIYRDISGKAEKNMLNWEMVKIVDSFKDYTLKNLTDFLSGRFESTIEYGKWIEKSFNPVHEEIFKGVPYLIYENGVIHK